MTTKQRRDPAAILYRMARAGILLQIRDWRKVIRQSAHPGLYANCFERLQEQLMLIRVAFEESEPSLVANEYCEKVYYKAMEPYEEGILTPNGREVF